MKEKDDFYALLHVEDDPDFAAMFEARLGRMAKRNGTTIKIDAVASFDDAIGRIRSTYDCIVSDYQILGGNGLDFLLQVRAADKNLPFVFLTGQGDENVAREAFVNGASDYFTKDISFAGYERIYNSLVNHIRLSRLNRSNMEARHKLRGIIEGSPVATYVLGVDHTILFWNQACEKLTGIPAEEVIGTRDSWRACYIGRKRTVAEWVADGACGRMEVFGIPVKRSDMFEKSYQGEVFVPRIGRWLLYNVTPLLDSSGCIIAVVETFQDITRMRRDELQVNYRLSLETALADVSRLLAPPSSDKDLNAALGVLGRMLQMDRTYIFQFDSEGRMNNTHEWCNEGVAPMIDSLQGIDSGSFPWWTGKILQKDLIVIEDIEQMPPEAAGDKEVLAMQSIKALLVMPLVSPDNEVFGYMGFDDTISTRTWGDDVVRVLSVASEVVSRHFTYNAAICELNEAFFRTRQVQGELEHIMDIVPGLVYYKDCDGRVCYANKGYLDALGMSMKDVEGKKTEELFPLHGTEISRNDEMVMLSESVMTFYETMDSAEGERVLFSNKIPRLGVDGATSGIVGVSIDITDKLCAEKKLAHSTIIILSVFRLIGILRDIGDEKSFLESLCSEMVNERGYFSLWTTIFDTSGNVSSFCDKGLGSSSEDVLGKMGPGRRPECVCEVMKNGVMKSVGWDEFQSDCVLSGMEEGSYFFLSRLEHDGNVYGVMGATLPSSLIENSREKEIYSVLTFFVSFVIFSIRKKDAVAALEKSISLVKGCTSRRYDDLAGES